VIDVGGLPAWGGLLAAGAQGEGRVVVAGIPYDGSATYRRGAAEAPSVIRALSAIMPPLDERGRSLGGVTLDDLGDLDPHVLLGGLGEAFGGDGDFVIADSHRRECVTAATTAFGLQGEALVGVHQGYLRVRNNCTGGVQYGACDSAFVHLRKCTPISD